MGAASCTLNVFTQFIIKNITAAADNFNSTTDPKQTHSPPKWCMAFSNAYNFLPFWLLRRNKIWEKRHTRFLSPVLFIDDNHHDHAITCYIHIYTFYMVWFGDKSKVIFWICAKMYITHSTSSRSPGERIVSPFSFQFKELPKTPLTFTLFGLVDGTFCQVSCFHCCSTQRKTRKVYLLHTI